MSCTSTCREHRLQHGLPPSMLETMLFRIRDRPRSCICTKSKKNTNIKLKKKKKKEKGKGKREKNDKIKRRPKPLRPPRLPCALDIPPHREDAHCFSRSKKEKKKSKQGRQRDEQDKTFSAAPDTHFSNPIQEDEFGLGGCQHWAYYYIQLMAGHGLGTSDHDHD